MLICLIINLFVHISDFIITTYTLDIKQLDNQWNNALLTKTLPDTLIPGSSCNEGGVPCGGESTCISNTCTCPSHLPSFDSQNSKCIAYSISSYEYGGWLTISLLKLLNKNFLNYFFALLMFFFQFLYLKCKLIKNLIFFNFAFS